MSRHTLVGACALVAWVIGAVGPALAADPTYYTKKSTWQETLFASREAFARYEAEQEAKVSKSAGPADEVWTPWQYIGAFQGTNNALLEVFPPETEIDLTKAYGQIRWAARPDWVDGVAQELSVPGNSAVYLYRTVTVKSAKTITGYFGSDDGMAFWLNGKRLLCIDAPRGLTTGSDKAKLELQAGENKLLFKIHNQSGGCGFYFSTSPNPRDANGPRDRNHKAIWSLLQRDFNDVVSQKQLAREKQDAIWSKNWRAGDMQGMAGRYATATRGPLAAQAKELSKTAADQNALAAVRAMYHRSRDIEEITERAKNLNADSLRMAIRDLTQTFGAKYPKGAELLARVDGMEKLVADAKADPERLAEALQKFEAFRQEALLANPLIDFDKLLLVKRNPRQLGLPQNWQGNCALGKTGYDNEIAVLSPVGPGGKLSTLFKPAKTEFVGDVDLNFDADKMLFSMPGKNGRWQIFEIKADGSDLRQVTLGEEPDVDNYDPCYLPDGRVMYGSTACFHGVPCVGGGNTVANLFRMDADGKNARQLTFDQDHDWCPAVMNDGRVMYTRWEYSDTAHYFTRILFRMNPDGTGQSEICKSNSYWPNSIFYARPIPNHPTQIVGIISGHHGVPRMGEMVLFDPAKGSREASIAVQRIPGHGKIVEPIIADRLVESSWPKFLHPYPLSDKYFLVSMQPTPSSMWGIYLVDTFDNLTLVAEVPGYALLEPVPFRKTPKLPVIPDRVDLKSRVATVYLSDIYQGDGLKGIPRGAVKKLRIYEPHYAYPQMGGHINIGVDGPWDGRRILGTVPVEEDGSASFIVPANTPVAVQPLDADGKALQVMRSWFSAMPGESLSCVGCHEQQRTSPRQKEAIAFRRAPSQITEWYGPTRGFSFKREVQPVLDKYCVGCHNGQGQTALSADARPDFAFANPKPDFSAKPANGWRNFTPSYLALHSFVRRPGPESDYHIQVPMEFSADTSEVVQMLKKGHHNVKLDAEAWDRLYTWIDMNVPDHGTWSEHRKIAGNFHQRRIDMRTKYANRPEDPEAIIDVKREPVVFVKPQSLPARQARNLQLAGWPFDASEAKRRQTAVGLPAEMKLEMAKDIALNLVLIPPGQFVMGDLAGCEDELPQAIVKIDKPFYMGSFEITNEQYNVFDSLHDSRVISVLNKDQGNPGKIANRPQQPVIRISWEQAVAYCNWLSAKTGRRFTLPSEGQWEYACRAGTATALNFGEVSANFGKFANLADERVNNLCRGDSPRWIPCIPTVNDGAIVTENVGKYAANAFGLYDMHGNVGEWTRSTYMPYPYSPTDGRDSGIADGEKVIRGGSFYDRPARARSSFRLAGKPWQRLYNTGFRVICEIPDASAKR